MDSKALKEKIQGLIETSNDKVIDGVVDMFVNDEITIRKKLIVDGLKAYEDIEINLNKIKPDVVTVDLIGSKTESFSQNKWNEKQKLEKQFKEIDEALTDAMVKGDYKKLTEKMKSKSSNEKGNSNISGTYGTAAQSGTSGTSGT